ncbi:uncharacterized protein LOC114870939 [Osmia bicornis bicornis]|uniref:uncharacterized protein LOC114870939 n=1 Tax=Osmia bicornis bicornis TaxID=1437191 RepID=UPI0010F9028F|nr:uncharacterized protein LOC114870939 [Osmia bicornis bicornis]
MNFDTVISIFIALLIATLKCNCNCIKDRVEIVTYGEPCVETRQLPIKIEGPKPPRQEEKIPVSLNFKVISDMFVEPRRIEYPIEIDTSCSTRSQSERTIMTDLLRGKTYTYNTYVPPASYEQPEQKIYNYDVEVPISIKENMDEYQEKRVQRLKGLTSRIDRILVPACEVLPPPSSPQC